MARLWRLLRSSLFITGCSKGGDKMFNFIPKEAPYQVLRGYEDKQSHQ